MKLLKEHSFYKRTLISILVILTIFFILFTPRIYASDESDSNLSKVLQEELANYGIDSAEKAQELYNTIISTEGVQSLKIKDKYFQIDLKEGYTNNDVKDNLRESLVNIIVIDEDSTGSMDTALQHFRLVDSDGIASSALPISGKTTGMQAGDNSSSVNSDSNSTGTQFTLGNAMDGLAGVVFWVIKLIPMIIANLILRIICLAINGVDGLISGIPLDKILFNQIPILSINFFQNATSGADIDIINNIRTQVSVWYVAIRNLSAAILAVMVLYVGIRMAISSVAEDKAKYKRMLADWVVSLVLLFVLHYIMILIININDGIVAILAKAATATKGESSTIMDSLWDNAMDITSPFTVQLGNTILYFMLAIMSFVFFATYIKRMITIAFLIMIAPIITITYSLDRMGDGKSQALNTWFKNFVYNILLQPFQCIIYIALVKTAIDAITVANLSSVVIAIIMVFFMYEAEDIIKEIFHFEGKSVANTIAQAALVSSAIGLVSKSASGTKTVKGYAGGKPSKSNSNTTQPTTTDNNIQNNEVDQQRPDNSRNSEQSKGNGTAGPKDTSEPLNIPESQDKSNNTVLDSIWGATKKVGKAGLKVGKVGMKLSSGIILGAAGLGTGNLTNGLTGFQTGTAISGNMLANMEEKSNLRKFAKDYRNASSVYANHDDNWIREHTKDLLNGDVQVKDYEKDYYNTVLNEMDRYIAQGLSADDAVTQVEQNVAGVQGNYITETGIRQKFTGKIKDKFKHGYGDNKNNMNNNNNQN